MAEYVWPCPKYTRISSPFGYRNGVFVKGAEFHKGIDLAGATGTPILAAKSGKVLYAQWSNSFGNWIQIDHGGGVTTRYGHASKLLVSPGQNVQAGQQIALVGSTGNSTGPHLHFEIQVNGTPKNPLNYVSDRDKAASSPKKAESSGKPSQPSSGVDLLAYLDSLSHVEVLPKEIQFGAVTTSQIADKKLTLTIQNGNTVYEPAVEEGVEWTLERQGSPGQLTFTVVQDSILKFQEGDAVKAWYGGVPFFYGFVFAKKRGQDGLISVTAYDQLRYLKNKDTYSYTGKTASQLLQAIASSLGLQTGTVEHTGYVIPKRLEENTTYFDMLQNALDLTVIHQKKLFVLYDDFGKLCLRNVASLRLSALLDSETGESYEYTTTIDSDVYNQVKLTYDNEKTGKREVYLAKDSGNIAQWGVLQYCDTLQDGEDGKTKADAFLKLYNRKKRSLTLSGVLGDIRVRAGNSLVVNLKLDDLEVNNYMVVERVKHRFENGEHKMDLTLIGGDFAA